MSEEEDAESRVKFIVGMFKHYQHDLTIPEQIALLTLWVESCVLHEEYEMAGALKKEMEEIQSKPGEVPQKSLSSIQFKDLKYEVLDDDFLNIEDLGVEEEEIKKPFYIRFFTWFKNIFKKKD